MNLRKRRSLLVKGIVRGSVRPMSAKTVNFNAATVCDQRIGGVNQLSNQRTSKVVHWSYTNNIVSRSIGETDIKNIVSQYKRENSKKMLLNCQGQGIS